MPISRRYRSSKHAFAKHLCNEIRPLEILDPELFQNSFTKRMMILFNAHAKLPTVHMKHCLPPSQFLNLNAAHTHIEIFM